MSDWLTQIALDRGQAVELTLDIKIMNNFNSSDFGSGSSDQSRCKKAQAEKFRQLWRIWGDGSSQFYGIGWGLL